jgi:acyl-CoA thioester hydrolase
VTDYRFFHPIEIRYGDIDAQRHVNNAHYFTLMEQARIQYVMSLGLWSGADFDQIGMILAEQSCTYLAPITLDKKVEVGVRTERMGSKSIEMDYILREAQTYQEFATGNSILVAYDYQLAESIPIPRSWRDAIEGFESFSSPGDKEDDSIQDAPE